MAEHRVRIALGCRIQSEVLNINHLIAEAHKLGLTTDFAVSERKGYEGVPYLEFEFIRPGDDAFPIAARISTGLYPLKRPFLDVELAARSRLLPPTGPSTPSWAGGMTGAARSPTDSRKTA